MQKRSQTLTLTLLARHGYAHSTDYDTILELHSALVAELKQQQDEFEGVQDLSSEQKFILTLNPDDFAYLPGRPSDQEFVVFLRKQALTVRVAPLTRR